MGSFNKVILMGNLTRDPELRFTESGAGVVSFGIAVNDRHKNKEGDLVETPCFVEVEAWNKTAEIINEYFEKGSSILIEGRLKFNSWEKDGAKMSRLTVRADKFEFVDSKKGGE